MLVGRLGERYAARHLRRHGLRIVARNVRSGRGEIDLVAVDGATVVFVEVKSRTERSWSVDLEKIDWRKRRALTRSCRMFLASLGWSVDSWRVDGVCVDFRLRGWLPRVVDVRWYRPSGSPTFRCGPASLV